MKARFHLPLVHESQQMYQQIRVRRSGEAQVFVAIYITTDTDNEKIRQNLLRSTMVLHKKMYLVPGGCLCHSFLSILNPIDVTVCGFSLV